jgi:hypothetical protein
MLAALQQSALAVWVSESVWAYPLILAAHTVGLALLVGGSTLFDLRLLGAGPRVPVAPLMRILPIMMVGLVVNAATGLTLFIAAAEERGTQPIFYTKVLCIIGALVVDRRVRRSLRDEGSPTRKVSWRVRALAVASLALWAGAIVAGRLIAYM